MNVSFTLFVDFMTKAGEKRLTEVRSHINAKADYDYYADFRIAASGVLRQNIQLALLPTWVDEKVDLRKRAIYRELVDGYQVFASRVAGWFEPAPHDLKIGQGFTVHVNPELGVVLDGAPTLVKLYCRKEPLLSTRADVTLAVMEEAFEGRRERGDAVALGVLDVRRNRLFLGHERAKHVTPVRRLVWAEGAAYVALYTALAKRAA